MQNLFKTVWKFYCLQGYDCVLEDSSMSLEVQAQGTDPVSDLFEIFPDAIGHWCARRIDGKVCGTFLERDEAVRFARRECLNRGCGRGYTRG